MGPAKHNHFQKVQVSETEFPATPQVGFDMRGVISFTMDNEGDGVVEYSFDGSTVHGDMTPGEASASLKFTDRTAFFIWFKVASGTQTVRVEGWVRV